VVIIVAKYNTVHKNTVRNSSLVLIIQDHYYVIYFELIGCTRIYGLSQELLGLRRKTN